MAFAFLSMLLYCNKANILIFLHLPPPSHLTIAVNCGCGKNVRVRGLVARQPGHPFFGEDK